MPESNNEDSSVGSGKIGLAGALGGIAAVITAVATLLTAYNAYSHSPSEAKATPHQETAAPSAATPTTDATAPTASQAHQVRPPAAAKPQEVPAQEVTHGDAVDSTPFRSATSISGYWSAIPIGGGGRTWVFFFKTLGKRPKTKGNWVTGTIQDPCTNDAPIPFDDGFYDGHALELRITGFPNGLVYGMIAEVNGNQIEGPAGLGMGIATHVSVVPGAAPCPTR
jgi:hypothetical protein